MPEPRPPRRPWARFISRAIDLSILAYLAINLPTLIDDMKAPAHPPRLVAPAASPELVAQAERLERILAKMTPEEASQFVRDLLDRTGNPALQRLPAETKLLFLQQLGRDGFSWGEVAYRDRLYVQSGFDPDFLAWEAPLRDELTRRLLAEPAIVAARANWAQMDTDAKVKALQQALEIEAEIYGFPAAQLQATIISPGTFGYTRPNLSGPSPIVLNSLVFHALDSWEKAMETTLHEGGHAFQSHLIGRLLAGELARNGMEKELQALFGDKRPEPLPADHPARRQAMLFLANLSGDRVGWIPPRWPGYSHTSQRIYQSQPLERHSWDLGPDLTKRLVAGTPAPAKPQAKRPAPAPSPS